MANFRLSFAGLIGLFFLMNGCATLPEHAFVLDQEALKKRSIQSQRFRSVERKQLMSAVVGVIQDLGFTLDEGDSDLGVFVGSKQRTAKDARQYTIAALQILNNDQVVIDDVQKFRISIIVYPVSDSKRSKGDYLVRTNFQRIVWNNLKEVSRAESLNDPQFFRDFFSRLSKSLFLDKEDL